tara:strand:- start:280 stop:567 length:288 start_codon:yes stop_codon:yes gene_type:complete
MTRTTASIAATSAISFARIHRISTFVRDMRDLGYSGSRIWVRSRATAIDQGLKEIRSKAHCYDAICHDELDNCFVMDSRGRRRQLIGSEVWEVVR